jgi:arylsulfatase A-like enzyme
VRAQPWTTTLASALVLALGAACAQPITSTPTPQAATPSVAQDGALTLRATQATNGAPNIVFILTDDQDASLENMPRLRNLLAEQGVTFARAFVNTPLCCPSRASLLTGLHAHTHGVVANRAPAGGFEGFRDRGLEARSVTTWLKTAGYRTALVGKYLNRYPGDGSSADFTYVPPGFDTFAAFFAPDRGSGNYYDYYVNLDRDVTFYPQRTEDYITDAIARQALAFIDAQPQGSTTPFFLQVNPNAPHAPPVAAPRHAGNLAGLRAPRVGAFDEFDVSDKPPYYQGLPRLDERALERLDELHRKRQETLLAVDELIERLVQRLEARGLLDNTFLVFSSDNGFMLGQHRFTNGKDVPYEESIRVPLVVRGPGVPRGVTLPHLVSNVDVPATFAEWARATLPATVEGRSFGALLRPGAPAASDWRSEVLIEHQAAGEDADAVPTYAGLRTHDYKYVEYADGEIEFYDLRSDPAEERNLGRGADPALLATLAKRLAELRTCRGVACR